METGKLGYVFNKKAIHNFYDHNDHIKGTISRASYIYCYETMFSLVLDEQLSMANAFRFLQIIPRQLCDNAGFDATDVLNKLRQKHALPSG